MPAWAIGPNGKLSLNAPASATRADAYAGFFKPRFVEGRMKLQCLLCDEKPCSFHVVDSKGDDVFPFANAFGHLATCGGLRCLRECDFGEAKGKVVKASSSADIGMSPRRRSPRPALTPPSWPRSRPTRPRSTSRA
jgi:hypothetical protein